MQLKIDIHFTNPCNPDIVLHNSFFIVSLHIDPTINNHKKSKSNANTVATRIYKKLME